MRTGGLLTEISVVTWSMTEASSSRRPPSSVQGRRCLLLGALLLGSAERPGDLDHRLAAMSNDLGDGGAREQLRLNAA